MIATMQKLQTAQLLMCLVLAGCGSGAPDTAAPVMDTKPRAARLKPQVSRAQATQGMVLASSPTNSAPIAELKFNIADRPIAGRPVLIEFALLPQHGASRVDLTFQASDGVRIASDSSARFDDISSEQVLRKSIQVTPAAEGLFYVNAEATFSDATDVTESRSFSIPLIVDTAIPNG